MVKKDGKLYGFILKRNSKVLFEFEETEDSTTLQPNGLFRGLRLGKSF